jgi:hypothetical protein
MHHILSKFIAFVNVDRDGLAAVTEFLRDEGYDVYSNPTGKRASEVRPNGKTVVIRALNAYAPRDGHFSPPEAVLVDILVESRALGFMGDADFREMLHSLASSACVAWGTLLQYAEKREIRSTDLIGENDSLTAEK